MSMNRTQRRQAVGALSWYGKQVRLVAAVVVHPMRRTTRLLHDGPDSPLIELATSRETVRLGDAGNPPVLPSAVRRPRTTTSRTPSSACPTRPRGGPGRQRREPRPWLPS